MKTFRVINKSKPTDGTDLYTTIIVTVPKPPYTDENILYKTGWMKDNYEIEDITPEFDEE